LFVAPLGRSGAPDAGSGAVRIRNRQLPEDGALGILHFACILAAFMIIAEKMQETMHDKMGKMMRKRLMCVTRLAPDGLIRDYNVAQVIVRVIA
jgi:hypothetical protein